MATRTLARGRLRRPELRLRIFRCGRQAWRMFGRHHYLSATLSPFAQCYVGYVESPGSAVEAPGAFLATLPAMGRRGVRRVSRIVVLPDFQGIGIGRAMLDGVAGLLVRDGFRVRITTGHPSMIAASRRSPNWRIDSLKRFGSAPHAGRKRGASSSVGRAVVSAEFLGSAD